MRMPSTMTTWSLNLEPYTVIAVCPIRQRVTVVPGIRLARACRLRVAVGIASSISRLTTTAWRLLTTSTTGDSPVTVTVSSQPAEREIGIDRRGKTALEQNALAPNLLKPEAERHRIETGTQIDDAVLASRVGDDGAGSFDQRGTGRFDRDAGQRRPGGVSDDAGNGRLGTRISGTQSNAGHDARGTPTVDAYTLPEVKTQSYRRRRGASSTTRTIAA